MLDRRFACKRVLQVAVFRRVSGGDKQALIEKVGFECVLAAIIVGQACFWLRMLERDDTMIFGGFPSPALHGSAYELARLNEHPIKCLLVEEHDDESQEAGASPNRQPNFHRKGKDEDEVSR